MVPIFGGHPVYYLVDGTYERV